MIYIHHAATLVSSLPARLVTAVRRRWLQLRIDRLECEFWAEHSASMTAHLRLAELRTKIRTAQLELTKLEGGQP